MWTHIFGYGEAGLRSLSALAGVPSCRSPTAPAREADLAPGRADRGRADRFNPLLIWYSQEARAYELLVLLER